VETRDNTALVRDLFDAFNDRDLDRVAAMVSEDFELVDFAAESQVFRGPQGILQWLQIFLTALPDAKTQLTNVVADGDNWVFTEFIGQGTHTGPLVGPAGTIPPTGRRIEFQVGELMRLEEGKFTLVHVYYDGATLMRQLGVFPPRPGVVARILVYQAKKLRSRVRERRERVDTGPRSSQN
jgi:steroid delta-isomerase-like uncharacterized protein